MVREIKFRAWNTLTKKMIDLKAITPLAVDPDHIGDGLYIPFDDGIILMQFTGLKDKNGKEIYEGDIVRINHFEYDKHHHIQWAMIEVHGMYTSQFYWGWNIERDLAKSCRVVGNVHENPELLKGE